MVVAYVSHTVGVIDELTVAVVHFCQLLLRPQQSTRDQSDAMHSRGFGTYFIGQIKINELPESDYMVENIGA